MPRFVPLVLIVAGLTMPTAAHAQTGDVQSAFVVIGPDGSGVARAVTIKALCPTLRGDGRAIPMTQRATAAALPLRPTQSTPENSKPSVFPVLTCEATIAKGIGGASIDGRALPLPRPRATRIVVIGDTGCRLKASEGAYQACNDPKAYPFAAIAERAAGWKPDLVIHVGDYLYRENPCPTGRAGCAGTPWGYGWDAWNADFFRPAEPLLRAAPWVVVRGNHENCSRAGQGWWRLLDPRPLEARRDCNDPADDERGDTSAPYAVPIGDGTQIVVLDLAIAGAKPIRESDYRFAAFRDSYARLDAFTRVAEHNIVIGHKPILAFAAADRSGTLDGGSRGIQSVFGSLNPLLLPTKVDMLLSGHIHVWEQLSFSPPHPSQFVVGFSGTKEDKVPLPATMPAGVEAGPGAIADRFSSWVDGFGYMTMQWVRDGVWDVKVWSVEGRRMNRCRATGRTSVCNRARVGSAS